jgi:hypothetical protein
MVLVGRILRVIKQIGFVEAPDSPFGSGKKLGLSEKRGTRSGYSHKRTTLLN